MTNAKINDQKKADADLKKAESEKRADQKKKEKKIKDLQGQGRPGQSRLVWLRDHKGQLIRSPLHDFHEQTGHP